MALKLGQSRRKSLEDSRCNYSMRRSQLKELKGSAETGFRWESLRERYFLQHKMFEAAGEAKGWADHWFQMIRTGQTEQE